jgi:hypothetical protein
MESAVTRLGGGHPVDRALRECGGQRKPLSFGIVFSIFVAGTCRAGCSDRLARRKALNSGA